LEFIYFQGATTHDDEPLVIELNKMQISTCNLQQNVSQQNLPKDKVLNF